MPLDVWKTLSHSRARYGLGSLIPLVGALCLAPGTISAQSSGDGTVSLRYGTVAPDAELQDLEGNTVQLLDYVKGKPALIEFWATWCEQCEALQPQLDQVQERFGERLNVVAVGVGVNQNPRRIKRHLEGHDPGYPYLFDARGAAVRAYNATVTAIVVMVDGSGEVAYTGVGPGQDLIGAVESLLGG